MTFVQFAILGVGVGALYVLVALGIVIIHRGSGIINIAQGAVGMAATYFYWDLHDNDHWVFAIAFLASVVAAGLLGVGIQLLVMRPLRTQSPLTRMLATLGVLITLSSATGLRFPAEAEAVSPSLPGGAFQIGSIAFPKSNLAILIIVIVITAILYMVYKHTRFGLATSAVTENRLLASSLKINPDFIAAANWALGSMLAAIAGILLAPITGLTIEGLTLLVIPALAVVVIAGFRSFPITLAAGIGLGILQTEVQRFTGTYGSAWSIATPFLVIMAVLIIRGASLPGKGQNAIRLPLVGSGRIQPVGVVVALVIGVVAIQFLPIDWVAGIITSLVGAIIILSIIVVTGYAGQLSLAQFALAGMGAWVAGRLAATTGLSFLEVLVVGVVAGLLIGVVVGLPALRTRGEDLAIATLGLAVAANSLIFTNLALLGGFLGTTIPTPKVFGISLSTAQNLQNYAYFTLICFAVAAVCVANLRRSRSGRRMLAIRSNERAAASLGVNVMGTKLHAFAISSMIAALGGILLVFQSPSINYALFDPLTSIDYVGWAVIGGIGHNAGSLFGSFLAPGAIGDNVVNLFSSSVQNYLTLASGILLILILIVNRNGVAYITAGQFRSVVRFVKRAIGRSNSTVEIADASESIASNDWNVGRAMTRVTPKELTVEDISVNFGGVAALVDVSLSVKPGQIVGLIGPNGAGKTTLIDSVTGFNRVSKGSVIFDEVLINKYSPRQRAKIGLARSFQSLELFDDLKVSENLLVASEHQGWSRYATDLIYPGKRVLSEGAQIAVEHLGLHNDLESLPGSLPYGRRRLVAIARALASEPSILLLDEPAAGLAEHERMELCQMMKELAEMRGIGILLVEHDVDLVMRTCDQVVALDFGSVIVSGEPSVVRSDEKLIKAYMGEEFIVNSVASPTAEREV